MEAFINLIQEKPKRGRPKKLKGGADALQKGTAAELRSYIKKNDLRNALSFIVHSGDKDPSKYGVNPYADKSNKNDPTADLPIAEATENIRIAILPAAARGKKASHITPEAVEANRLKQMAQNAERRQMEAEDKPEDKPFKKKRGRPKKEGKGWVGDKLTAAKKAAQGAVRTVGKTVLGKDRAERLERYGDAVLFLSKLPLPPSVKDVLRKHGDEPISKLVIVRNPVQKVLTGAMNAVSLGSFSKKFGRLPYDDLFHLAIQVTTHSGVWGMEKNEVITFTQNPAAKQDAEYRPISLPSGITMNILMTGSEKIQGSNFTRYDASNNNCQDFIMSLLKGTGLGNDADYTFVKQDTDTLFANDSFLRKLSRKLTNVGASVATAISGVDDKPIASTAAASQFEIPSPAVLDGAGAFGIPYPPAKKGRGRPRKGCPHCGCSCCR
jgi:hypothetical protein